MKAENNTEALSSAVPLDCRVRLIERLMCAALGHRYIVERVLNHGARKVGCTRCHKHWAMHDETRSFLLWDAEFEELYAPGGMLADIDS